MTKSPASFFSAVVTLGIALGAPANHLAAQDVRELSDPTSHLLYVDQTPSQLTAFVNQGYRIVDLEYRSGSGGSARFDAVMVANSGAYASGWWWYHGITGAQMTSYINANQGRLIDLEIYEDSNGNQRFAGVMVPNTGANQKAWWWLYNATSTDIANLSSQNNARIVDLDTYTINGVTRRLALMISNTGADQRNWSWHLSRSLSQVTSLINSTNRRLYDLERTSAGTYDIVLVEDVQPKYWYWWVDQTATQLVQRLNNYGSRAIDIERYTVNGSTRYAMLAINNSNALTTSVGNLMRSTTNGDVGAWLRRVNGSTLANLNGSTEFEPASTMKTLHHAHAMRRIHLGQSAVNSLLTVFTAYATTNASCPVDQSPVAESLATVLRKMMEDSDNARTQAVTAYYGESNINTTTTLLGMTGTSLNHRLGCANEAILNPNSMTLRDLHSLHQQVANGWLGNYRDLFYDLMREDLSDLDLDTVIDTEGASIGLPAASIQSFKNFCRMAHKGGDYTLTFFTTWHDRSEFGWISLPFIVNGVMTPREYTFGAWVNSASNDANAAAAIYTHAVPELLRAEIRAALQTWTTALAGVQTVGAGCGNPVYTQAANTLPRLGTTLDYDAAAGYPFALTAFTMGLSDTAWNAAPLPASLAPFGGGPGCMVFNDVVTADLMLSDGTGGATGTFSIPNAPGVVGFEYLTQFWSFGPNSIRTSNSLRSIVGL